MIPVSKITNASSSSSVAPVPQSTLATSSTGNWVRPQRSAASLVPVVNFAYDSILTIESKDVTYYRVSDIEARLEYSDGSLTKKLKTKGLEMHSVTDLVPMPQTQISIIRSANTLYETDKRRNNDKWKKLVKDSKFVTGDVLKWAVANSNRKSEALEMAINVGVRVTKTCIQAEVEFIIKRRFLSPWHISFVGERAFGPYRPDLLFPEFNGVLEIDEHGHSDRDPEYENKRQKFLEESGHVVVRFNPHANMQKTLEERCESLENDLLSAFARKKGGFTLLEKWLQHGEAGKKLVLPACLHSTIKQVTEIAICAVLSVLLIQKSNQGCSVTEVSDSEAAGEDSGEEEWSRTKK